MGLKIEVDASALRRAGHWQTGLLQESALEAVFSAWISKMGIHSQCTYMSLHSLQTSSQSRSQTQSETAQSETIHNFSHSCVLCLAIWINWFKMLFKSAVLWVDTCYLAASLLGKGIERVSRRLVPRSLSCVVLCFPNTLISSILLSPLLIASIPLLVAKPLLPASPFIQGKSPSLCCWEAEDDTSAFSLANPTFEIEYFS